MCFLVYMFSTILNIFYINVFFCLHALMFINFIHQRNIWSKVPNCQYFDWFQQKIIKNRETMNKWYPTCHLKHWALIQLPWNSPLRVHEQAHEYLLFYLYLEGPRKIRHSFFLQNRSHNIDYIIKLCRLWKKEF